MESGLLFFIYFILICQLKSVDSHDMEIISYVGGRPDNRQSKLNILKRIILSNVKLKSVKTFSLPEIKFNPKVAVRKAVRYWWTPFAAALFAVVPLGVYSVMTYFESHTSPIPLDIEESEYDILNREMARLALNTGADIGEDGSISGSVVKYSFKEPVTFTDYTVKAGDTISGISLKFHLNNISTIIAVNNIDNVRSLNAGKKLVIPSVDGLYYKVQSSDTIQGLAKKFSIPVEDILDTNDLTSDVLTVGKNLFIPGAKLDKAVLRRAMGDTFTCPLKINTWRLTSRCGYRSDPFTGVKQYHPGIDMATSSGTPIFAALSGKVVACGWSNIYGNYVIIDHQNGYQTLYGHMSKKLCTLNQEVNTSTRIGLVGSTGYSTGPHLHFTVYKNGKVVDPLTLIK
ncbi:MAG: M23 family metallopeptidase [Treponema sp.]|nr:M23 family metallopeptidase [Treponema sp.]